MRRQIGAQEGIEGRRSIQSVRKHDDGVASFALFGWQQWAAGHYIGLSLKEAEMREQKRHHLTPSEAHAGKQEAHLPVHVRPR